MSYIADVFIFRGKEKPEDHQFKKIGALFYDEKTERASVKLTGFVFGKAYAKAKDGGPFITGDLSASVGKYEKDGEEKNSYQFAGYISSREKDGAPVYELVLEAMPLSWMAPGVDPERGYWLSVFSGERKAKPKPKPESPQDDGDNLLF